MALYREGKAAMAADGTVTGTGTKWQSSLSLIRPGATIMFLSSPIQMAVVNKVVSDTEIKAITTKGAVVASSDYAILLSDSLTVDGLAQDVAETLRYYQSQETVIADAVEFFKNFDFDSLQNLANQIKADSESAGASATAAAASESAAKTSETNAKASEIAAETARDQVQQIINDAGEQSTLVVLAQNSGASKITTKTGLTVQECIDNMQAINVLDYIPASKRIYIGPQFSAEETIALAGDLLPYILEADAAALAAGKKLAFTGGYFPISDEYAQTASDVIAVYMQTYLIPYTTFPSGKWLHTWAPSGGQPRKSCVGMGYDGLGEKRRDYVGGFNLANGCANSSYKDIFARKCWLGGVKIHPKYLNGVGRDIVGLNVDNVYILDCGTIVNDSASFNIRLDSQGGAWTDGSVTNINIAVTSSDLENESVGPEPLRIVLQDRQMFNVKFDTVFTGCRMNRHVWIDANSRYLMVNCKFSNFSGENHDIVDGVDTHVSYYPDLPQFDAENFGDWNVLDNVYAHGALGGSGLRINSALNPIIRNMTFQPLTNKDKNGNYLKALQIGSSCENAVFRDCNIRDLDVTGGPERWKYAFKDHMIDNGKNTLWDSSQMTTSPKVHHGMDFYTANNGAGRATNATSQGANITVSTGANGELILAYPAVSTASAQQIYYPILSGAGAPDVRYHYVTLKLKIAAGTVGSSYVMFQMWNKQYKILLEDTEKEYVLFMKFPPGTGTTLNKLIIHTGNDIAGSAAMSVTIADIIHTVRRFAYPYGYEKSLLVV